MTIENAAALEMLLHRQQAQDTLHAYARAVDTHDLTDLQRLITDDVELERVDGVRVGSESFLKFYRGVFDSEIRWSKHLITNVDIELAGDRAYVTAYFEAAMESTSAQWIVFGEYSDIVQLIGGQWLIARKQIDVQRSIHLTST
ncbi:nuclear transport factor 2 family protein [Haloactinomyces albus]|uniref:Ketosteroid isomerase-like protein n=1 Tax=Haloactinomyces albus TaxID=1352928 RepID=A0AAE3ZFC0_9ACTN|nr:nuclear transport factor 2 family protein [Haloactinomyces albus]MDR7303921.1 ketosteroid isomerase-like protein [Haloactinomyces albus]